MTGAESGAVAIVLEWAIAGVFAAWGVITLLNQSKRTRKWIGLLVGYDIAGLIPIWTFFAPNPGDTDTHVLFRDRAEGGRVTPWKEIVLAERKRVTDLWNPKRRMNKAVVDVVYDLTKADSDEETGEGPHTVSKERVLSFPYLLVLNYVSTLDGDFGATDRQFAVVKTAGWKHRGHPSILLVSAFHSLTGKGALT